MDATSPSKIKLFQFFFDEIAKITTEEREKFKPTSKVEKGETLVGTVPEDIRDMLVLFNKLAKESDRLVTLAEADDSKVKGQAIIDEQVVPLQEKISLIKSIFWVELKDTLKLWSEKEGRGISVNKDWAVTIMPKDGRRQGMGLGISGAALLALLGAGLRDEPSN